MEISFTPETDGRTIASVDEVSGLMVYGHDSHDEARAAYVSAMPFTDADIAQLRVEAATAGDLTMAALCAWALGEKRINHDALLGTEWAKDGVTRDDARAECERVIREARASR